MMSRHGSHSSPPSSAHTHNHAHASIDTRQKICAPAPWHAVLRSSIPVTDQQSGCVEPAAVLQACRCYDGPTQQPTGNGLITI